MFAGDEWAHPKKFTEVDMKDFDAIAMTGGSGVTLDMCNFWELHKLIMVAYNNSEFNVTKKFLLSNFVKYAEACGG